MKKLLPHIIYLVIIAFFILYSRIKAKEARMNHEELNRAKTEAEMASREAVKQAEFALENASELARIKNQLTECQSSK